MSGKRSRNRDAIPSMAAASCIAAIIQNSENQSTFFVARPKDDGEGVRLPGWDDTGGDIVASQSDAVEEAQGAAGLAIVAHRGIAFLAQVEQVGSDVLGAEALGRAMEVASKAGDAPDVGLDRLGGEVAEGHVVDHAAAQGGHVRLLCV